MGYVELCPFGIPGRWGGFSSDPNSTVPPCSLTIFTADHTTAQWYSAFRWITVVWVIFLFLISMTALIISRWQKRKNESGFVEEKNQLVSNIQDLMLGTIAAASLDTFLYHAIDPGPGAIGVMPKIISQLFFSVQLPFLAALFGILIFHWVEVYLRTVDVLKREQMLQKVNSNYESNVTLSDIVSKVTTLTRIKYPMIAVTILTFLVSIVQAFMLVYTPPDIALKYQVFWGVYFFVVYGIESLGFILVGNYMVTVLPPSLQKRMRSITIFFSVLALLYFFVFVYTWTMFTYYVAKSQPWVYLVSDLIGFWVLQVVVSVMLSRFVTVSSAYPFINLIGNAKSSRTGGSGRGTSKNVSNNEDSEEVSVELTNESPNNTKNDKEASCLDDGSPVLQYRGFFGFFLEFEFL